MAATAERNDFQAADSSMDFHPMLHTGLLVGSMQGARLRVLVEHNEARIDKAAACRGRYWGSLDLFEFDFAMARPMAVADERIDTDLPFSRKLNLVNVISIRISGKSVDIIPALITSSDAVRQSAISNDRKCHD